LLLIQFHNSTYIST